MSAHRSFFVAGIVLLAALVAFLPDTSAAQDSDDDAAEPKWIQLYWDADNRDPGEFVEYTLDDSDLQIDTIAQWDNGDQRWLLWRPGVPAFVNGFTELERGAIYWFRATYAGSGPAAYDLSPAGVPSGSSSSSAATASFDDGTHQVGVDIAAGTYRAPGGSFCSWQRLSGFSGEFDEIIAIEVLEIRPIVTILSSDAGFTSSGCGQWMSLEGVGGDRVTSFGDGTYRVGVDIAVGTYRAPGGDSCSWQRLSGFTGDFEEIIAIEVLETRPIVTIVSSDVGFKSNRCGEWTRS